MKKFLTMFLIAAFALVSGLFAPKSAEAVPSFARQIGQPCFACHYQHIPKLNAFGRDFKLGGFTQTSQDLISDEGMSIASGTAPVAFIMKYRYAMQTTGYCAANDCSNGKQPTFTTSTGATADSAKTGRDRGEWNLHDEAAFWIAGRLGENVGIKVELPGPTVSSAVIYSKDFGGIRGGVSAYGTDAQGPGWGMALYNTSEVGNIKGWESAGYVFPARILADKWAASGLSFFAGSDLFFVNLGLFGPASTNDGGTKTGIGKIGSLDAGFSMPFYYRLAVTPKVADGLDLMVGLQGTTGKGTLSGDLGAGLIDVECDTMAIDMQVQTDVAGMSLEVTAEYQTNGADNSKVTINTGTRTYASGTDATTLAGMLNGQRDAKAMGVQATLGLSKAFGVKFGYLTANPGDGASLGLKSGDSAKLSGGGGVTQAAYTGKHYDSTYMSLGAYFNIAQNVHITPEYTIGSGSGRGFDNRLMLMFMVGI